jgi:hypothetical protein
VSAAPWPYRVAAETIAAALRSIATLRAAGRTRQADEAEARLRARVGTEAIDAVRGMPVVTGQGALFEPSTGGVA